MAMQLSARRAIAILAVLGSTICASSGGALAQSAQLSADDLKPLYAMAADISEAKQLVTATCSKCHGVDGISTEKNVPNLATQRPTYIYRELKAFKAGTRANSDMHVTVKFLSDDTLVKVAAYFAALDPAEPPHKPAPPISDPVADGKAAAAPCAKCHGDEGISNKAGIPNLIGFEMKYLVETMKAYKTGDRKVAPKYEDMTKALAALTDKDLTNIALYYGLHKTNLAHAQTPIDGNPAVTKESLARCVKCHDENGIATSAATPSLAGQEYTYVLNALHSYKDGSRDDDVMGPRASKLNDDDMTNLAAYYASLTPQAPNVAKPLSPDQWAEKCDHCHGINGNSARPDVPALASQRMDYLDAALRAYRAGDLKSPEMAAMSGILSDDDIAGLAAHYAYQKARGFVFLPVPVK